MATSKKTTKKAKTGVKKVTRHKPFDLTIKRPEQVGEMVDALQGLEQDRGWLLLKQIFEGNIAVLEAQILRKVSDDGKTPLKEEECDRLRDRLAYLEELLAKPQELIKKFTAKQPEVPDYDPYHKTPVRRE